MSRKTRRHQTKQVRQASRMNRTNIFIATGMALLLVFVVGTLLYKNEKAQSQQQAVTEDRAALASDHSPTLGKADAKVHIVEFLDPACEACAIFYPNVKKLLAENPDRIRLSVRHVPFHRGSDYLVRILEAARSQGKYWQTLETIFASQDRWAVQHAVQADLVWPSLDGVGLDLERVRNDMDAPEVSRRMEQDLGDARALGVTTVWVYSEHGAVRTKRGCEAQRLTRWIRPRGTVDVGARRAASQ